MLLYLFDFMKVFFEGASKSSTVFFTVYRQVCSAPPLNGMLNDSIVLSLDHSFSLGISHNRIGRYGI